ncbi:MAG: hypothetical protein ACO308_09130, partial [Burkholderiaceae bacterium]
LKVIATRTGMGNAEGLAQRLLPLDPSAVQASSQDSSSEPGANQLGGPPALPAPGAGGSGADAEPAPPAVVLNSPEMTAAVAAAAKAAMKQDGVPA